MPWQVTLKLFVCAVNYVNNSCSPRKLRSKNRNVKVTYNPQTQGWSWVAFWYTHDQILLCV